MLRIRLREYSRPSNRHPQLFSHPECCPDDTDGDGFQTRTGIPSYLARRRAIPAMRATALFQTRTGIPSYLAIIRIRVLTSIRAVSNPNGHPQLFSPRKSLTFSLSKHHVSNPNGHPQLFSRRQTVGYGRNIYEFQTRTGIPSHLASVGPGSQDNQAAEGFKPERASPAI